MAEATTEPRLVFSQTFEGLFVRGLAGLRTPALEAKLNDAGLDLSKPFQPAYPAQDWARWFKLTGRELFPTLSEEAGHRQLGQRFIRGYAEGFIGRAMFGTLKVIGPMRVLGRLGRNFRSGNNFTESRMTEIGPTEAEVWLNQTDGIPGFYAGVVEGASALIDVRDPRVDLTSHPDGSCTLRVRWSK